MGTIATATRGVGEFAVVEELPDVVIVIFAAITHLADPWLLFGLLASVYWFSDERVAEHPRRAGATAIGVVTAAYASVALAKATFALSRPPGASPGTVMAADVPGWLPTLLAGWYRGQLVSDGFGFPSGHAVGAVAAYGSLALLLNRPLKRRSRIAIAGVVVLAVGLSRVVVGVHYLVDVVVGAALGVAVLAGGLWIAGDPRLRRRSRGSSVLRPIAVFALAAGFSIATVLVAVAAGNAAEAVEAGIGIGTGVGGVLGWKLVAGDEPAVPLRVAVPGLAATGLLWVGAFSLGGGFAATVFATALAVVAVIAMPSLATRIGA